MRRGSITLSDDFEERLDAFLTAQAAKPSLTAAVRAVPRRYLEADTRPGERVTIDRLLRSRLELRSIAADHGAQRVWIFGSTLRLRGRLEELLGVPVDVVTNAGLAGDVAREVLVEAIDTADRRRLGHVVEQIDRIERHAAGGSEEFERNEMVQTPYCDASP